ncbi:MAG: hypothetical protein RL605_770, partial [Actinomycetota bacterium]
AIQLLGDGVIGAHLKKHLGCTEFDAPA